MPEHDSRSDDDRFIDGLDRVTRRVGRALMVGVPVLVGLLLAIPSALPIGPMASLALAVLGTVGAVVAVERCIGRGDRAASREERGREGRRPGYGLIFVLGAVIVFIFYAILISALGGSGG